MDGTDSTASFTARIQNFAFFHGATAAMQKCRFEKGFDGVLVDTGATRGSSAGEAQYHAYCNFTLSALSQIPTRRVLQSVILKLDPQNRRE